MKWKFLSPKFANEPVSMIHIQTTRALFAKVGDGGGKQ